MGKNKLKHFRELIDFPNVFQKEKSFKGKWQTEVFKNNFPVTLELACGKGEYAVGMAELNKEGNFIGCDIKGARIYTGAKKAIDKDLHNVCFLRMQIDHLPEYFDKDEVDEIWITFADPFLPASDAKRRLTAPKFIEVYKQVLKPEGTINLKTDSDALYHYTLQIISALKLTLIYKAEDIYANKLFDERLNIKTYYENKHLAVGKKIKYIKYKL